jgi:hypothetical protein
MRLAHTQVYPALRYFEAIAPNRHLDIGVVKDNEGSVAAQFERAS